MKFLFDLDETLVWGDIISLTSAELLRKGIIDRLYTNQDIHSYDLKDLPELLRERIFARFADPQYVWAKHPIPGVYAFLWFLETKNHETGMVTARPKSIHTETARFMKARFPGIEFELGLEYVNEDDDLKDLPSKMTKLKEIAPDYYFDDNARYCAEAKQLNINTYLITNKHTPWNHEFAESQKALPDPVKTLRNVSFFPETIVLGG